MKEKSYMLALPGEQEPEGRMEVLRRLKNAPDFKVVTADTEDEGSLRLQLNIRETGTGRCCIRPDLNCRSSTDASICFPTWI